MQARISSFIGELKDASGSITAGNVAQTILPFNADRRYFLFQNISDTVMYLDFGINAAATTGIKLLPDSSIIFEFSFIPSQFVSVLCSVAGKQFICKYG